MFHLSRRQLLTMVVISAVSAPLCAWAAAPEQGITSHGIVYARHGGTYRADQPSSMIIYGAKAYEDSHIVLDKVILDDPSMTSNRRAFFTAEDSTIDVRRGFVKAGGSPTGFLAQANNGTINIGMDEQGQLNDKRKKFNGDIIVGGLDTPMQDTHTHSEINIAVNTPTSKWKGVAFNVANTNGHTGAINLMIDNRAQWNQYLYSSTLNTQFTTQPLELESHVNVLAGASERSQAGTIRQYETYPIYVNRLSGHVNVFFEHNDNDNDDIDESTLPANKISDGQTAYDYWGGNVYIQSAAPGAALHVVTNPVGLNTADTQQVETVLGHLANKVYYTNYAHGERNLTGTVGIAAHDDQPGHFVTIQNGNGTTLEGDIEWQADRNGQGRYRIGSLGRVYTGPTDTLHMRGVRSAVFSNVGTWRTMAEDMYRLRALQHGESTGLWAHVGAGRYAMQGMGGSNESTYTRIQGGYDKSYGHHWIVGGQVDYLRGHDNYINHGTGKDHAFALGAYGTKQLGGDAYFHVETKAGRMSNDFTIYGDLFDSPWRLADTRRGKVKANVYSMTALVGKRNPLKRGLYVEPQVGISYMRLGGTTFTTGAMTVHQSPINSVAGKLGIEIGHTIGAGNLYARFDIHHAFTGNVTTQYNHTTTQADIKGTWTDVAVGGRYGINTNNSLYADISTGLSGTYKQSWAVNAGFTHRF